MKQVIFLTVNHHRPLSLRELHSTDETIVWRDPGGSWACLRPISDYKWIHPSRGCRWYRHIYMWRLCEAGHFSDGESPWTPPLEGTSLHRRNNNVERPWGILSLFTTRFWLWVNSHFQRLYVIHIYICMWRLCEAGCFSYGESLQTPPLEGISLHRRNNSVERPWGILSLFTICFQIWVISLWHRHVRSLWSKSLGAVRFCFHESGRGEMGVGLGVPIYFRLPMALTQAHGLQVS